MSEQITAPNGCLVTGCPRSVRSRGLCDVHYTGLALQVSKGNHTWVELEKAGVCLPSKKPRGINGIGLAEFMKSKGVQ
jgi:hypothetical protein